MTLRQAREKKGFNQHDIFLLTGISQTRLSLLERGYYKPRLDEMRLLCEALGVNASDLEFIERRAALNVSLAG